MRMLRLCNVLLSLVLYSLFLLDVMLVIKGVKRLVLRPLKTVVESWVDLIFYFTRFTQLIYLLHFHSFTTLFTTK